MTITLAAVYAPIGFQGGLTGALFREFAFTLAGAVFISGVVALTLSPMMSSRLLRAEHEHGWLARNVDARVRGASSARYARGARGARCAAARRVYAVWIVLRCWSSRCTCSRRSELAPNEDQGVVFGAHRRARQRHASSRSTPYTDAGRTRSSQSTPEFEHSFQITLPHRRLRRHVAEAVGRAQAQRLPDPGTS